MTKSIAAGRTRAWVEVDLDALVRNARRFAGFMGRPLLPMVKADGYGLGAEAVTQALEPLDPWGYGVATVEEGAVLRRAGITRPIAVLTPLFPQILHGCITWDLRPSIGDSGMLEAWVAAGGGPFHLEVDTGLSRGGVPWHDDAAWRRLRALVDGLATFEGIYTHFHSAGVDPLASHAQWERFQRVVAELPARPRLVHAACSDAERQYALDLVRPGIHLYGLPVEGLTADPVVRLEARVVAVRRLRAGDTVSYGATWRAERATTIATLGIGYADGLPRALSNRGRVELGGVVVPVAGIVAMDLTMVDAGELPVQVGDVATIFGGQVSVQEQAELAGTIPYELLTGLGTRLPRHYRRTA